MFNCLSDTFVGEKEEGDVVALAEFVEGVLRGEEQGRGWKRSVGNGSKLSLVFFTLL